MKSPSSTWIVNPQGEDPDAVTVQEFQALPVYQPALAQDDEKSLPEPAKSETTAEHL